MIRMDAARVKINNEMLPIWLSFDSTTYLYFSCSLHRAQYLSGTVVSALGDQHGEFLLKELVRRWSNHKIMNQWMQKFFQYLDRCRRPRGGFGALVFGAVFFFFFAVLSKVFS